MSRFDRALDRLATLCERVVAAFGACAAVLTLPLVVVTAGVAALRYLFGTGTVWLQELTAWLHAAVFLLAAGWVLTRDGHVRVDVFQSRRSARGRAWTDLAGAALLLLPMVVLLLATAGPFAWVSFQQGESSGQPGGMPLLWPLKALLPLGALLLLGAGVAQACRASLVLRQPGARGDGDGATAPPDPA